MENNVLNALDFLLKSDSKAQEAVDNGYDISRMYSDEEWLLKMVAYASQITPTKLEQRQATRTKIAEVLDREYETRPPIRIVVPSEGRITNWIFDLVPDLEDDADFSLSFKQSERRMMMKTANLIVSTIRTLNPGAEVVEADKFNLIK